MLKSFSVQYLSVVILPLSITLGLIFRFCCRTVESYWQKRPDTITMMNSQLKSLAAIKPLPAITFGAGSITKLSILAEQIGTTFLVITGANFIGRCCAWATIEKNMADKAIVLHYAQIAHEPSPEDIDSLTAAYGDKKIDAIIAIGGGSAIDAGKAVAAMLPGKERIEQFLEGVGNRKPDGSKLPFIAVPTTAGTGSEASANAVITKHGPGGFKKSLRHDNYIPDYAIIDPRLTHSCPPALTASCAMDCFTQLVEGFVSTQANAFTDAIAWSGLEALERSLVAVRQSGEDLSARSDLAYAALCSGIVLANAGLGIVHGLAPNVGSMFAIPHGSVCGTLMAAGNEVTYARLQKEAPQHPQLTGAINKYRRLGNLFCAGTGSRKDYGAQFIDELYRITELFALPKLSEFGATAEHLDLLARGASLKNNPVELSEVEISALLAKRL
jgi:alcohol dehydrogenase class IV